MIGCANHHQFVLATGQGAQIGVVRGRFDQADVERMVGHLGRHGFRVGHGKPCLNLRKAFLEFTQNARQQILGNRG